MRNDSKTKTHAKTRVFIVEDHPIVLDSLVRIISDEPDFFCVGTADRVSTARAGIEEKKPDLVLLDLRLDDQIGMELLTHFKTALPNTRFLVISSMEESLYGERVLQAGARGFVNKTATPQEIRNAIRAVLDGKLAISQSLSDKIVNKAARGIQSPEDSLTARELEVFTLLGEGNSSREIAGALGVSIKTIEAHRSNIKEKLGLEDAAELVFAAINWVNARRLGK